MSRNLNKCVWIVAMILSVGITGGTVRVVASPLPQRDQGYKDYSKNKNYQQGMRDGRDDNAHHRDHFKNRKFKKDEDRQAYEAGYQNGHRGDFQDRR